MCAVCLYEAGLFCYVWWFPVLSFPRKCLSWLPFTQSIQARLLLRAGHSSHASSPYMWVCVRGELWSPVLVVSALLSHLDRILLLKSAQGLLLWPTLALGCLQRNVPDSIFLLSGFLWEYSCPLWVGGCGLFSLKPSIKPYRSPGYRLR